MERSLIVSPFIKKLMFYFSFSAIESMVCMAGSFFKFNPILHVTGIASWAVTGCLALLLDAFLCYGLWRTYQMDNAVTFRIPVIRYHRPEKRRRKRDHSGWVYLLKSPRNHYKIGHTNNPENRLRTFNVKLPFDVEYEHLIECKDRFIAERDLHALFAAKRINGEWFALDPDDIAFIKSKRKDSDL